MSKTILTIDQGTTSSRAIVFDTSGNIVCKHQTEFPQIFPEPGWVEHDPEVIWQTSMSMVSACLQELGTKAKDVACIGITNQRETTVIWDRKTGKPIYNAIVWQDRRTASYCLKRQQDGIEDIISQKTGLLLDPYFSATKICWLLDNIPGARERAMKGELAFGTIDTFLLWRLTKGAVHATDITNASRTMLYNIDQQCFDDELLDIFSIPRELLPKVLDNTADFGVASSDYCGRGIPITGMAGDQQAALIGQACIRPGMAKSTYGTGCFLILNTGNNIIRSGHNLLSTIAYRVKNHTSYALEGSIFIAGAVVQWLRDSAKIIDNAYETEAIARSIQGNEGVYFVPAFTGLGAPYWDPNARGAIVGLTRDTGRAHIVRAALESVCFQTYDLLQAIAKDGVDKLTSLRVDGGMIHNAWLMQMLADILQQNISAASLSETTALGAAFLAGIGAGLFTDLREIADIRSASGEYTPQISRQAQKELVAGWGAAINQVMAYHREI